MDCAAGEVTKENSYDSSQLVGSSGVTDRRELRGDHPIEKDHEKLLDRNQD